MSSQQPIQMPTAFVCSVRVKFDVPTDRPGDLEAYLCPICWQPHLVTGRRGAKVLDAPCCGRPVRLLEATEVSVRARLLRGADDMPELQRALVRKLAVSAMTAANGPTSLAEDAASVPQHVGQAARTLPQSGAFHA